ncbi:N-acetylmuramoyl-L-alanine amidase [Robertmurraya kyonggiensis]|uniref:N-acetylmuramoyl-L-alanine amidase n=1 Tax=Robertmurraya kyonggiensis TaxID=1037680 RepID=UPI00130EB28D|nr:N-acetylmuramoyl-L-alanine amidase [Robertmurraya kyonggiensis]
MRVIYPSASQDSVNYQNTLYPEIVNQTGFIDRGKKRADFHVVRETTMPAILTENGFVDNTVEAEKLKQSSFLDQIAQGHVNGLVEIFGLKKILKKIYFYTGGYSGE